VIRRLIATVLLVIAVAAIYQFVLGDKRVTPRLVFASPTSVIGTGEDAVGVSADGLVLAGRPVLEGVALPRLPPSEVPENGRLAGPMLQQARVLGGAPPPLRPYLESSYYGESGVNVELTSGIELRFGDASRIDEKWQAAAAILADPSITTLDYVDLHAPRHPSFGGTGHTLPPIE
jgi:cell division protein FtsQ